jgi:hypothetical protein
MAKFGTIPDLFYGGLKSTFDYRVMLHGNSIKSEKVLNQLRQISNVVIPSHRTSESLRNILRPIRHYKTHELRNP